MDLARLVRGRRMTRRFRPDTVVPDDIVLDLLDLAGRAPSAGFSQGWEYVVLRAPHERELFWAAATPPAAAATGDDWLAGVRAAPVLVLAYADEPAYRARYAEPDKAPAGRRPVRSGLAGPLLADGHRDGRHAAPPGRPRGRP